MQDINNLCMGCMSEKGDEEVCSHCGFNSSSENPKGYLPIKTDLDGRYIIGALIESNGEGATYLAWDKNNDRSVRLREFYPDKLVSRGEDGVAVSISTDNDQIYGGYLDEFLDLARNLSECNDLTNLLPVTDIFEANGTAYYVTENVKSITLREFLLRNGGLLTWEQFRPLITPVISTLSALHLKGIVHCGISPETLLVGRDGIIRIVGFCIPSARMEHSDLNSQLYPGYAALEQYGYEGKQGAWTDVYGLTATIFRVLVGNPPPEATERVSNDRMIIPAKIVQSMPQSVLSAMAKGLAILSDDRTKSMDKLKSNLNAAPSGATSSTVVIPGMVKKQGTADSATGSEKTDGDAEENPNKKYIIIAIALTAVILLIVLYFLWTAVISPNLFENKNNSSDALESSSVLSSDIVSDIPNNGATTVVPQCVGQKLSDVLSDVNTALTLQFTVIEKNYSNEYARNTIFYQSIEAGSTVAEGTTIEIKISLGSSMLVVPNVRSMSLEEAKLTLVNAGFQLDNITVMQKDDATIEFGRVVGTDIESGRTVSADSAIIIYQSNHDAASTSSTTHPPSSNSNKESSSSSSNGPSSETSTESDTPLSSEDKTTTTEETT